MMTTAAALTLAAAARAQNPAPNDAAGAARAGFKDVNEWITKAAALVPPEKYSYKPVATVRSFGQVVAHVADAYTYYCGMAAGKDLKWSDATEKGATDKSTVAAKLKAATAICDAAYANGRIAPLFANAAHANLHYGNIVTYMRMLGLVPPSS